MKLETVLNRLPNDWHINPLDDLIQFISYGFTNPMPTVMSGVWMITANDINHGQIRYSTARQTSEFAYDNLLTRKSKPIKGDLLLTKDGSLGRVAVVGDEKICINQSVAVIRPNPTSLNTNFLKHLLQSDFYQKEMILNAGGSTIKHIYITIVDKMLILTPPLAEQQKIAHVLTDADNYISALEKLIEKKKMIKEGLMVNLLTGKQRLKEFAFNEDGTAKGYKDSELGKIPEDWNLKYFTDVFSFLSTASFSRDQLTAEHNTCACIHYGDIHTKLDYCIDTNTFVSGYVSTNQVMNYAAIQQGDLIIADASEDLNGIGKSIEVLNQPNIKVVSGLHTFLARDIKENFVLGFRSFISSNPLIIKQYKRLASGLKIYSLSKSTFKNIILPLPSKDEQESISKILFNHIKEIETLNKKLEKAKAIKIGMMQKLLTGEIRLA